MRMDLLLECAYILPRTDRPEVAEVCMGYIDHAYDVLSATNSEITKKSFFTDVTRLAESYAEDDEDPYDDDTNKSIKDYDKTSIYNKTQKNAMRDHYYKSKLKNKVRNTINLLR